MRPLELRSRFVIIKKSKSLPYISSFLKIFRIHLVQQKLTRFNSINIRTIIQYVKLCYSYFSYAHSFIRSKVAEKVSPKGIDTNSVSV